jgi:hypothetical protein
LHFNARGPLNCILAAFPPPWSAEVAFRTESFSVRIVISKLIFAAAVLGAALCFNMSAGRAGYYGDERWCAVTDQGADVINWSCEYDTLEDCRPAIYAGNHGYCGQNPYWRPEPTNSGAPTGSSAAPTVSSAAPTGSKVAH